MYKRQATDLSEDEAQMLTDYLTAGGKLMVLLGDTSLADLTNLSGVPVSYTHLCVSY